MCSPLMFFAHQKKTHKKLSSEKLSFEGRFFDLYTPWLRLNYILQVKVLSGG